MSYPMTLTLTEDQSGEARIWLAMAVQLLNVLPSHGINGIKFDEGDVTYRAKVGVIAEQIEKIISMLNPEAA